MKKKRLMKAERKIVRKALRKVKKGKSPPWVTALAAIAGAVVTALSDRRERVGELVAEVKDRAEDIVHKHKKKATELPNGMVMGEQPGPV